MSYSRWSFSCWYTYSTVYLVDNEPTLNVNCEENYPLSELKECKADILDFYRNKRFERNPLNYHGDGEPPADRYTEEEIQELSDIIDAFIKDEEEELNGQLS